MIITREYANTNERRVIVKDLEARGFSMLHDDFYPGGGVGNKPYGVLTFTNEPRPVQAKKLGFEPLSPSNSIEKRLEHIENWLKGELRGRPAPMGTK